MHHKNRLQSSALGDTLRNPIAMRPHEKSEVPVKHSRAHAVSAKIVAWQGLQRDLRGMFHENRVPACGPIAILPLTDERQCFCPHSAAAV